MSRREEFEFLENFTGVCILLLAGGSLLGGAGVLAYQIIDWLQTGEWFPVPVWIIFELMGSDLGFIFEMEWRGLQKILLWLLELPLSIALPVSGILLALGVGWFVWPFVQSLRPPPESARSVVGSGAGFSFHSRQIFTLAAPAGAAYDAPMISGSSLTTARDLYPATCKPREVEAQTVSKRRDELAILMTPEHFAEAQKLACDWAPNKE